MFVIAQQAGRAVVVAPPRYSALMAKAHLVVDSFPSDGCEEFG